ncbi:MAG: amidohydrolase [Sphingobacteriaceae bacterium]
MNKLLPVLLFLMTACKQKDYNADLLIKNAVVYTVDLDFNKMEAMVIKDGKILAVGKSSELEAQYLARSVIDAGGKPIYPGFIDAHTHFYNYGLGLREISLSGTKSWNEVLDSVRNYARKSPDGWLTGAGWDQNDWKIKEFPDKALLDKYFPMRPVLLIRIDGHAAIANQAALDIAGIKSGQQLSGGEIKTTKGVLTGVLLDNAVSLVREKIPPPDEANTKEAFLNAQKECVAVGLTTVDDCGLDYSLINTIEQLQHRGDLKMRLYVMLNGDSANLEYLIKRGAVKTPHLNVRSFKFYADGALGSRGACLLQPYADQKNWFGFMLHSRSYYEDMAQKMAEHGFQMNTHAIGDSANRVILQIYAAALKQKNDFRWRIEHAQIVDPQDMSLFMDYNIIPSVQPSQATSDMYWAGRRLGSKRLKDAYAFKDLLKQNNWLPLGTDFPVENINPLHTFYAAVERRDLKGFPSVAFQPKNALSRTQALHGITIWAAKANFEEKEKGSLEPGKYADFVMLDQDIMTIKTAEIPNVKVLKTFINGENVYEKH